MFPRRSSKIIAMHSGGFRDRPGDDPNLSEARCLEEIKARLKRQYRDVPLVADVHHQGSDIAVEVAKYVDKIRINPGLFVFRKRVERPPGLQRIRSAGGAGGYREGAASGAARLQGARPGDADRRQSRLPAERLTVMYGDTPEGMVQSALEYIQICERHNYRNYRDLAQGVACVGHAAGEPPDGAADGGARHELSAAPGVTEAGDGMYARIKSTTGIGTLLPRASATPSGSRWRKTR